MGMFKKLGLGRGKAKEKEEEGDREYQECKLMEKEEELRRACLLLEKEEDERAAMEREENRWLEPKTRNPQDPDQGSSGKVEIGEAAGNGL